MASRKDLVARIVELSGSIAATGQFEPKDSVVTANLTLPQVRLLYMLAAGPARITDISQVYGMALSNASTMVERLVRKGMVERVSDPNDRRVALACLTNRGREAFEAMTRSNYLAVEKIAALLSIDDLEVVAQALKILDQGVRRLEAANEDEVDVRDADD